MPESYIAEERLPQHSTHFYSTGDIILQAHTVLFRVHKDVLCQHSEVFKDIFELAEPENAEDPPATPSDADPRIVIYDNPDELALLLDFLYGNYINYENTKRCLRLTLLAHKYDISTLVEICCNHVICQLPIDSTAEAHETVSKYRDDPTLIPLALRVARLVEVPELLPWVLYMLSVQSDADYHLSTQSEEDRLLVQSYAGVTQKIRDMHPTIAEWWDEVVCDFVGGDCGANDWDCARGYEYSIEYGDIDDSLVKVKSGERDPIRKIWESSIDDLCASCEEDWSDCTFKLMESLFEEFENIIRSS